MAMFFAGEATIFEFTCLVLCLVLLPSLKINAQHSTVGISKNNSHDQPPNNYRVWYGLQPIFEGTQLWIVPNCVDIWQFEISPICFNKN